MLISSRTNSTIKQVRRLRHRKEREETGAFFAEGIRIVGEAVDLEAPIELCVVAPDLLTSEFAWAIVRKLEERHVPVVEVTAEVFASVSLKDGPQGIGAIIRQRWERLEGSQAERGLCWTALEEVQDPGNLGTILRTSDAVGGNGIILLGSSTDPYDSACLRASMGAIFSQRLIRSSFTDFAAWKIRHHMMLIGTSDSADTDYQAVSYPAPVILLMGSERLGLLEEQKNLCDVLVRIPMVGRSDSLNLAVATGVMLYEIFNQNRSTS